MKRVIINIPNATKEYFVRLKNKYNPDGSKLCQYQKHLSETLREFDSLCREHNIVYYLAYGTLLGAVRHKGFIPWDDDADLWMDRDNYAKLEKLMKGDHHQLTKNVYVTMGIRPELWSPPYAYIDIFILDCVPKAKTMAIVKEKIAKFLYMMIKCRERMCPKNRKTLKPYDLLIPIALFLPTQRWKNLLKRISTWPHNPKHINSNILQIYNNCFNNIKDQYPANCDLWEPIEIEFENHWYYAPKGYDELLRRDYGEYMTLPNDNEIQVHGIVEKML